MNTEYIIELLRGKLKDLDREIKYSKSTIDSYLKDNNEDWSEEIKDHEEYIKALQEEKEIILDSLEYLSKEHFKSHHKYIEEFIDIEETLYGCCKDTGRDIQWKEEREIYGFDERETWDMGYSFFCWLYERLMMFKEIEFIDLNFHKFNINGKEMTQIECIDKMLDNCKEIILDGSVNLKTDLREEVLSIWKECINALWW